MQDAKNILIAAASSASSLFAAIEARSVISILSAFVLPILLFSIGKAIDIALQIYLKSGEERRRK